MKESCRNPWRKCDRQDIELSIVVRGKTLPICHRCWSEIADSDSEWGNMRKRKEETVEEFDKDDVLSEMEKHLER